MMVVRPVFLWCGTPPMIYKFEYLNGVVVGFGFVGGSVVDIQQHINCTMCICAKEYVQN